MKHGPTRMLYRYPGEHFLNGDYFDYIIVPESETESMLDCGWYLTTQDAKDAHDQQDDPPEVEVQPKRRGLKDLTTEEIELISRENCSLLALVEKYNITYHTARKIKANELDKKTIH